MAWTRTLREDHVERRGPGSRAPRRPERADSDIVTAPFFGATADRGTCRDESLVDVDWACTRGRARVADGRLLGVTGLAVDGDANRRTPGASSARNGCPGEILVAVGLTPARRVNSWTSGRWASVVSVTTVPEAPARPLRPERCKYALYSAGGSA